MTVPWPYLQRPGELHLSANNVSCWSAGPSSARPFPVIMMLSLALNLSHCSGVPEPKGSRQTLYVPLFFLNLEGSYLTSRTVTSLWDWPFVVEVIVSSSGVSQKLIGARRKMFELVLLFSAIFIFVQTVDNWGDVILQCTMHEVKKRRCDCCCKKQLWLV